MASLFRTRSAPTQTKVEFSEERRQLTVLFYDIVGSTAMLGALDPEDIREVLLSVHDAAKECIEAEQGKLVQVMGDGGMAYFGYPNPTEDAAFQALKAARGILDVREERVQSGLSAPDVRIGVATSVVILSTDPNAVQSGGLGAVGVAPNLAARLQSAAKVNTALVGPTTRDLTFRAFDFDAVDGLEMKGFPDVRRAFELREQRDVTSRFAMTRDVDNPLVARRNEAARLQANWSAAQDGKGSALLIVGDAGVGKSRLTDWITHRAEDDARVVLLQCQPTTGGEALHPIVTMYEEAYRSAPSDPDLADAAEATAELVHRLEDDQTLSASLRRKEMVQGCAEIFRALTRTQPLLIVAEDLHWVDEVTEAILSTLAWQAAECRLMIVGTSRPENTPSGLTAALDMVELGALSVEETEALVRSLPGSELSNDLLAWIVQSSDGNPLFATELSRHARDAMDDGISDADILTSTQVNSLRDLLAARLDSTGNARQTALVASVVGRDVPLTLLQRLTEDQSRRNRLETDLERLVGQGIKEVHESGRLYSFRHALMRDAAYESQPRAARRKLHGRIVDLAERIEELADLIPGETLADHSLNAGRPAIGAQLLIDAAETSLSRSALAGPRRMLERALDLAGGLDDPALAQSLQLQAIALLGPLVTQLDGHRAAAALYERGQSLVEELEAGARGHWIPILWGWWFTAPDQIEQTRRSEVLIASVGRDEPAEARLQALHCAWATFFDGGEHDRSLDAVEEGLALYDPKEAELSRYRYGHDARVCGLGERSLSLWMQGDTNGSLRAIADAEAWADETGHAGSVLHALDIATQTAFFDRNFAELDRLQKRIAELAGEDALPAVSAKRQIFAAWGASVSGRITRPDLVDDGLRKLRELGVLEDTPLYADVAAQVAAAVGSPELAPQSLDKEIETARDSGLIYWLPELLRRRALLEANAGSWLDEGLELARSQNAWMLVLRNATTRMRLDVPFDGQLRDEILSRSETLSSAPEFKLVQNVLGT